MTGLKNQFAVVQDNIAFQPLNGYSATYHYPLLEILRKVNGGSTDFNPEALQNAGIDPLEFRAAWAVGFAKETLHSHDKPGMGFGEVVAKRCQICLDTTDEYSFGNFLSDDIKTLLSEKMFLNATPSQLTLQHNA